MNILVVDDEESQRLMVKNILSLQGWDVFLAENGEEALQKMERQKVDLIGSDIYMPVMDGFKLRKTVREMPDNAMLPLLFISGYDDQLTVGAVRNPKIEGFFKKGKPVTELIEWVRYLTTPEDMRPKFPPGQKPTLGSYDPYRKRPQQSRN